VSFPVWSVHITPKEGKKKGGETITRKLNAYKGKKGRGELNGVDEGERKCSLR